MDAKEAIKELIAESPNWSQNKIASRLQMSSQLLSARLNPKGALKTDILIDVLGVLGYEVVIVPAESKLPKNSIALTNEEEV